MKTDDQPGVPVQDTTERETIKLTGAAGNEAPPQEGPVAFGERAEKARVPVFQYLKKIFSPVLRWLEPYRSPQSDDRVDVLDGIRVMFILLVAWFHFWQQSWLTPHIGSISLDFMVRSGYEWVDAMLLLSGFLLYLPYAGGKKLKAGEFYKKRFARIVPSYLLFILIMLFAVVFPQGGYRTVWEGVRDILAHLTFTHNLFDFSYTGSPINGVAWTLAVEVQFYLLFPLLCACFRKKPLLTWLGMSGIAFLYRYLISSIPDTTLYINQLPAFFDVYANGFLAAAVYLSLRERLKKESFGEKVFFTALFVLCLFCAAMLMRRQAAENGWQNIHLGQLDRRFIFSVILSCMMISAAFSVPLLRFLLGNRLMRILCLASFQFYLYHQALSLKLKEWNIPPHISQEPNMTGEQPWQTRYAVLCFAAALAFALIITFLFERPLSRLILTGRIRKKK
ncbi:MAG: hypothetical protein CW338_06160 [Clostridiales bacterium]|nr:hypothetical protein [Clostridiales bacterium]